MYEEILTITGTVLRIFWINGSPYLKRVVHKTGYYGTASQVIKDSWPEEEKAKLIKLLTEKK